MNHNTTTRFPINVFELAIIKYYSITHLIYKQIANGKHVLQKWLNKETK